METGNTLLDFFYRLVDDEDLLARYLRDPNGVMAEFGVEEAHRNLVLSGNLKELQELIQATWRPPVIVPVIAPVIKA